MKETSNPWNVFAAVYGASVVVVMGQFMVPPVMPLLMDDLGIGMATAGWLMSVFSVAGVLLAVPAAFILMRLGPTSAGVLALGCAALGSVAGALAPGAGTLLVGRVVQGVGLGLMTVLAPAVISMWFPAEKRGLPMGIWSTWVPFGGFAMFNIGPGIASMGGWRTVCWFVALLSAAALLHYGLSVKAPDGGKGEVGEDHSFALKDLVNPAAMMIAVVFGAFNFAILSVFSWGPSFLADAFGMTHHAAGATTGLVTLANIPAGVLAGALLNRIRQRNMVLTAGMVCFGITGACVFQLHSPGIVAPFMLLTGLTAGIVPPAVFTLAPETASTPGGVAAVFAVVAVGMNAGMMLGPPVVGAVMEGGAWSAAAFPIGAVMVAGLIVSLFIRKPSGASA